MGLLPSMLTRPRHSGVTLPSSLTTATSACKRGHHNINTRPMDTCTEQVLRTWWFIAVILLSTRVKPAECTAISFINIRSFQETALGPLAASCEPHEQRQFVKFAFSHVGTLEELWNALSSSAVHNVLLSARHVEMSAANCVASRQPPLLITDNLSIVGNPSLDSWSFLRSNFAMLMVGEKPSGAPSSHKPPSESPSAVVRTCPYYSRQVCHVLAASGPSGAAKIPHVYGLAVNDYCLPQMRMADGVAVSSEKLIMTSAHSSRNPSSPAFGGSCLVSWQQAVNLSTGISHQTKQISRIQAIEYDLPQVGFSSSNDVPYQKRCWRHRTAVVESPADRMGVSLRRAAVRNSIVVWAQNIKVRCQLITGGTRGHLPYTCSIRALNSSRNGLHRVTSAAAQQPEEPEVLISTASTTASSTKSMPNTSTAQHGVIILLIYGVTAGAALAALTVAGFLTMTELHRRIVALNDVPGCVPAAGPCGAVAEIQPVPCDGSQCPSSGRSYASDVDQTWGMASDGDDDIIDDGDLYDGAKLDTSDTSDWIWVE